MKSCQERQMNNKIVFRHKQCVSDTACVITTPYNYSAYFVDLSLPTVRAKMLIMNLKGFGRKRL
jgi:hypothetical protein